MGIAVDAPGTEVGVRNVTQAVAHIGQAGVVGKNEVRAAGETEGVVGKTGVDYTSVDNRDSCTDSVVLQVVTLGALNAQTNDVDL